MYKYLEKTGELTFDKIFNQRLGTILRCVFVFALISVVKSKSINGMQSRCDSAGDDWRKLWTLTG